jgi:predicted lipid carrier protein YhbT
MWMHRLDISKGIGKPMELDPKHDGRILALVMREMAQGLATKFKTGRIYYELAGVAGGSYYIGDVPSPAAKLRVDAMDFALLASGRTTVNDLITQKRLEVSGDQALIELALANTTAPF